MLEKEVKNNLFKIYQQEITQRRQHKDDVLFEQKRNDRNFMEQAKLRNEEENQKKLLEKQRRVNENMQEYNQFWMKKDEDRKHKFSKYSDVNNMNNYATNYINRNINNNFQNVDSNLKMNNNSNLNSISNASNENGNFNHSNNEYGNTNNNINSNNPNNKFDFDSKKDHLNPILNPDYIGIRKIQDIEKNTKIEGQRIYRNMLDAQMNMKPYSNEYSSINRENSISLVAFNKRNSNEEMYNSNPCKNYFLLFSI